MSKIERQIQVNYRHQIHFTEDVFSIQNSLLANLMSEDSLSGEPKKLLVVLDQGVANANQSLISKIRRYCTQFSQQIDLVCDPLPVPGGEASKGSWPLVKSIMELSDEHHIDRHSYIMAVGGGAVLDMVGLASATAHRGVRHIRIPTTTLSQNDSGVGVKNGINFFGKKNFLGTFSPPFAVINDLQFIKSLPQREKKNGFIEAVKVALIRDESFFEEIESSAQDLAQFDHEAMRRLIFRCAELHVNHIATSGDPFEFGSARPLDFGHWAAHKLEQLSSYEIRHGEAVAIGIGLDTLYAKNMGFLSSEDCHRILCLIRKLGFDLYSPFLHQTCSDDCDQEFEILRGLEEFREHLGGQLTITLLQAIGSGFEVHEMNIDIVKESMIELKEVVEEIEMSL